MVTVGPGGVAMRLTDVFDALGLRRAGTTAIDVPALLQAVEPDTRRSRSTRWDAPWPACSRRVVALTDPAVVLVGGPWGRHPSVLAAVAREFADAPLHVPVEAAAVTDEPSLTAARETALGAAARRGRQPIFSASSTMIPSGPRT